MQTSLYHAQINIRSENLPFYRALFGFLGWQTLYDADNVLGVQGTNAASLWFVPQSKDAANDYDGPGLNHLGIGAQSIADVDATVEYLRSKAVPPLFDTPRHRPEFSAGPDQTYYQVMFESPDRILFEVVYTGPMQG